MSKEQVVVFARRGLGAGFGLAGASVIDVEDARDAGEQIIRLGEKSKVGVILIEDELYFALSDELRRQMRRNPIPVVVPIPGPRWEEKSTAREYIIEILRRAIGYRVRLK